MNLPVATSRDGDDDAKPSTDREGNEGGIAVLVLLVLYTANQWARSLIFYTVDFKATPSAEAAFQFMNMDLGFDEAQYGVLASIGFAALFSISSLIAGGLVDRVNTRNLLMATSVVWSGATIWQGAAGSFAEVLGARMTSGVGQAFANPASYAILRRLYPPERLASVNGLYASGVYLGGGLAALSVLLDASVGWRELSVLVGGLGLLSTVAVQVALPPVPPPPQELSDGVRAGLSAPLVAVSDAADGESDTVRGDERGTESIIDSGRDSGGEETDELIRAQSSAAPALPQVFSDLKRLLLDPTVALLLFASALRFLAGFTIGVWIVPFYRGAFPGEIGAEFAIVKAAINGVAGSASATGGGVLADRLSAQDARFKFWVPAAGSLLAIPFWLGTLNAPSLELSLASLFCEYLLAECWFGPTVTALQAAAPAGTQGLTTGVFSFLTLVGNLAPYAIGLAVQSGGFELQQLLAPSVAVLYTLSALVFVAAGQAAEHAANERVTP